MTRLLVLLGLGLAGVVTAALPHLVVRLAGRSAPDVLFRVDTSERLVALTIDDGPSVATPEILDVLEAHGVRATFFVIGDHLQAHPELASRLLEAGHELAHHMMRDEPSIALSPAAFLEDFDRMDGVLRGVEGAPLFRPGSGWFDRRMVHAAAQRGYRTVLGSVYPFDAQLRVPHFSRWFIRRYITPGAIVVLHDGAGRGRRTAAVLRGVLPELERRGFEVVPVSELFARSADRPAGHPAM